MSLPESASIENLTGKYTLNKSLSHGLDKVLELVSKHFTSPTNTAYPKSQSH